jgi:putative peptidoglycan lipid II flippase
MSQNNSSETRPDEKKPGENEPDKNQLGEKKQRSVGSRMGIAAIILAASILLSRILGFLREAVIAYMHGANFATDAYYAAFTLPDLMAYLLAGGTLSVTFIPLFSGYISRGEEEAGWRMFSTIASTMGLLVVLFVLALEFFTPYLIPIVNPGFVGDPRQLELAIEMTRIVVPAQMAFYLGGLLQATLFVREVFWPAALAPLVYNVCIILGGVLLEPWLGIKGFAVGVVIGALLGPLLLPVWAARKHIKFRFRFAPRDPDLKVFVLLSLPLMIGVSLVTVDEWLLKYFGSMSPDGAITWLNNSRKMMLVLFAVIGQAAGQAALPFLTRLFHEGKEDQMGEMLATSLQRVGFLALVGAAGLIVTAEPVIWLVFQRGEFTPTDATQTADLLVFFAFGLVAWAMQSLAVRGFYARKNTIVPMLIGTVVVAISLPIYWWLYREFGVRGLAASTSIGISLNAVATVLVYRYRIGSLPLGPIGAGLGRGAIFAAACGGAAWGVRRLLEPYLDIRVLLENVGLLFAMGAAFFGVAALLIAVMHPPELEVVLSRLRKRFSIGS